MILITDVFLSIALLLAVIVSRSIVNPLKSIEITDEDPVINIQLKIESVSID